MFIRNLVLSFTFVAACICIAEGQTVSDKKDKKQVRSEADSMVNQQKQVIKGAVKESKASMPDSVGMSYENGKWVLPKKPSSPDLKKLKSVDTDQIQSKQKGELEKLGGRSKDLGDVDKQEGTLRKTVDEKSEKFDDAVSSRDKVINKADSLKGLVDGDLLDQLRGDALNPQHIYSSKSLKKLYDSLGINKMDTLLALAASKREVSKEDLLKAVNAPFEASPFEGEKDANGIAKSAAGEAMNDQALKDMKKDIPSEDLSNLKLPSTDLQQLPPMPGWQLPTDSIPFLDSLRKLDMAREKLKLNENEITGDTKNAIIKEKPSFWDRAYFEGVVSFTKEDKANVFHISPSLGFRVAGNLSVGFGPNILVKENLKKVDLTMGYRAFVKYEIFSQRGYLQVEDNMDPAKVTSESVARGSRHSIFAGGGYLQPLGKTVALNFCLLYRVNNKQYSDGLASPWNVRFGISTIGSRKKESN